MTRRDIRDEMHAAGGADREEAARLYISFPTKGGPANAAGTSERPMQALWHQGRAADHYCRRRALGTMKGEQKKRYDGVCEAELENSTL